MSSETASKSYKHRGRPTPVKNPGPPNRKIENKLAVRRRDFFAMTEKWGSKAPPAGAYHCPGSRQR